jgi:hypothetical protein
MKASEYAHPDYSGIQSKALVVGVVFGVITLVFAFFNLRQFFHSYLISYILWFGLGLGSLALLMVHHLTGGGWGFLTQRLMEAGSRTLPLLALLFVPVLLGVKVIYPWADAAMVEANPIIASKTGYLNIPMYIGRVILYFGIWLALMYLLNTWSRRLDESGDTGNVVKLRRISGPGIVLYVLTLTFASVDWGMSLEPEWFSSIYGALYIVSQGLTVFAFNIIVLSYLAEHAPISRYVSIKYYHHLGNLLLAFVVLWAYISFSQFLIIWSGNLPEEIGFYLHREGGGLTGVSVVLMVFHFAIPMFLLFFRRLKKRVSYLRRIAVYILVMRCVDLYWNMNPAFHPNVLQVHLLHITTFLALGGIWVWFFLYQLGRRDLLPLNDPRLYEAFSGEEH